MSVKIVYYHIIFVLTRINVLSVVNITLGCELQMKYTISVHPRFIEDMVVFWFKCKNFK
jgi:hypothetical protein